MKNYVFLILYFYINYIISITTCDMSTVQNQIFCILILNNKISVFQNVNIFLYF